MTAITTTDITNKTALLPGTGTFDLLMESVNLQLADQYDTGRLTGSEYSTVYLGALQVVLQQSIEFILRQQSADRQATLLISQNLEVIADTSRKNATSLLQDDLIKEKTKSEALQNVSGGILDKQLADTVAGTLLKTSQNAEVTSGTTRNDAESTAKIAVNNEQVTASTANTTRSDSESVAKISEINEKISLVIAQTSQSYESVKSSQDKTIRENLANNSTLLRNTEEIDLLKSKDLEELANTVRKDKETASSIISTNYEVAIKAQQELLLKEKNGKVVTTYTYYTNGVDNTDTQVTQAGTSTTTVFANILGPVLSTVISSGADVSTTQLDKALLASKDVLIAAQTLGFKSDTKQKLLKQMQDGFTAALSIAGVGNVPEANQDASIDQLFQDILNDLSSPVIIQKFDTTTGNLQNAPTTAPVNVVTGTDPNA